MACAPPTRMIWRSVEAPTMLPDRVEPPGERRPIPAQEATVRIPRREWTRLTMSVLAVCTVALAGCGNDTTEVVVNTAPTASAGADQVVVVGVTVSLDASASSDAEGDPLSYSWVITSIATGSLAALSSPAAAATTFSADVAGVFEVQVTVSDGAATATATVTIAVNPGTCDAIVDMFPVPVSGTTSPFPGIDDSFLEVPFATGFQFSFYGTQYSSVFLNTNGGMTFGGGNSSFDEASTSVTEPGIAVFWGDLDAGASDGVTRANQMTYEACSDGFFVRYTQFQDHDDATWNNTATASLYANGKVVIEYGDVLSQDILAGVFDGTHTDDRALAVADFFPTYFGTGTGIILFDEWGSGPTHVGELSNTTVAFDPAAAPANYQLTIETPASAPTATRAFSPQRKGPKQ